jgi:hypothetical protein
MCQHTLLLDQLLVLASSSSRLLALSALPWGLVRSCLLLLLCLGHLLATCTVKGLPCCRMLAPCCMETFW